MAVASVMSVTCTGTEELASSPLCPLPSCPNSLLPQQDMVPVRWSAQEYSPLVAIAVASAIPTTSRGTEDLYMSPSCPLPSCPNSLLPQQDMLSSCWSAQE